AEGLAHFRRLEREARGLLRSGAVLLVELDPRNIEAAEKLCGSWAARGIESDLAGRRRFLVLQR
ncbi:MAG TPA: hypothetical protein VF171_05415, partial [Trueperaceae bacterium]